MVRWREANGAFRNRQQLMDVSGLGPRTFELSAGCNIVVIIRRATGSDSALDVNGYPWGYQGTHRLRHERRSSLPRRRLSNYTNLHQRSVKK